MCLTASAASHEGAGRPMGPSSSLASRLWATSWRTTRSRQQKMEREGARTKRRPYNFTVITVSHVHTLFDERVKSHLSRSTLSYLSSAPQFTSLFPLPSQVTDDYSVIGRNLFKKETNLQLFVGLKVTLSTGESGLIEGGFGQSGKFKIRVPGKGSPRWLYTCSQSPKRWMESLSPQSFWVRSLIHPDLPLDIGASVDTFQDAVRVVGPTSWATFPGFLWGLPVFRGKSAPCLFYLLWLWTRLLCTRREGKSKTFKKRTLATSSLLPRGILRNTSRPLLHARILRPCSALFADVVTFRDFIRFWVVTSLHVIYISNKFCLCFADRYFLPELLFPGL